MVYGHNIFFYLLIKVAFCGAHLGRGLQWYLQSELCPQVNFSTYSSVIVCKLLLCCFVSKLQNVTSKFQSFISASGPEDILSYPYKPFYVIHISTILCYPYINQVQLF